MKLKSALVLGTLVMVGCGGGGGSSPTTNSNNLSGLADPQSLSSEDYDVRQLRLSGIYSNHNLTGSSVIVALSYESDASRAIFLSGGDEVVVYVDGASVPHQVVAPNLLTFNVVDHASNYEVVWYRNGEIIAQSTASQMPSSIALTSVNDYAGTINYSWVENSNTEYYFVAASLYCNDQYGQMTSYFYTPNDYNYELNKVIGGTMSLSLSDFGATLADLQSVYTTCDVSFDLSSHSSSSAVVNLNHLSNIRAVGTATNYINLF